MAGGFMDVINNVGKFGEYLKDQMGIRHPTPDQDQDVDDGKPKAMTRGSKEYQDQLDELGHYNPNAPKGR